MTRFVEFELSFFNERLRAVGDAESDLTVPEIKLQTFRRDSDIFSHYANWLILNISRWNIDGVQAVIHDDGLEATEKKQDPKHHVTVAEVLSAMDEKYEILRRKLLWEMIRAKLGE